MNRGKFLTMSAAAAVAKFPPSATPVPQSEPQSAQAARLKIERPPIVVRAGFTRRADGTQEPTISQQTVVRSIDSEGRLAAFVVPAGQHEPYRGAPFTSIARKVSGFTLSRASLSPKSGASVTVSNMAILCLCR